MNNSAKPALDGGSPVRTETLPFCRASIGDREINEVVDTLQSGWLTTGPRTKRFEKEIATFVGAERCVALNSCTSALHLALVLADVGPDDEVITTPITFPATANVIVHRQAVPVFADVENATMNLDPESVSRRITSKTKAIIPVHMCGYPCDMTALESIARDNNLVIIQDSAHCLESEWDGKKLPDFSLFSTYSFYATKNITCGEGGALVSNDAEIMDRASTLSLFGISKDAWKRYNVPGYSHWETTEPGYKYNMFDIQAALGLVQLSRITEFQTRRQAIVDRYNDAFRDQPGLIPWVYTSRGKHANYIYVLRLNLDNLTCTRDTFMKAMEAEHIGIGIHFRSLLHQKFYAENFAADIPLCPNAQQISNEILSIPLYPDMSDTDVGDVIEAVVKLLGHYRG